MSSEERKREAWYCPRCDRYHAPHCDTCPTLADVISETIQLTYDICHNCGDICLNAACPRRSSSTMQIQV